MRVSQVIAAVAKVSCKHGLWLVAHIKKAGDPAKSQKSSAYIQAVWLKTRENLIPGSHYIMEEFVCKGESEKAAQRKMWITTKYYKYFKNVKMT